MLSFSDLLFLCFSLILLFTRKSSDNWFCFMNLKYNFWILLRSFPLYRFFKLRSDSAFRFLFSFFFEPVIYAYFLLENIMWLLFFLERFLKSIAFWSLLWCFLYIGVSSLCLYNITTFFILQDGILSKLTVLYLCKVQIYV